MDRSWQRQLGGRPSQPVLPACTARRPSIDPRAGPLLVIQPPRQALDRPAVDRSTPPSPQPPCLTASTPPCPPRLLPYLQLPRRRRLLLEGRGRQEGRGHRQERDQQERQHLHFRFCTVVVGRGGEGRVSRLGGVGKGKGGTSAAGLNGVRHADGGQTEGGQPVWDTPRTAVQSVGADRVVPPPS